MSNCTCHDHSEAQVPDFSTAGFDAEASAPSTTAPEAAHEGVLALKLAACLTASYNPGKNQICFTVPVYGNFCVDLARPYPVGGQLKACMATCGHIIPRGLKATISLNGSPTVTKILWGTC